MLEIGDGLGLLAAAIAIGIAALATGYAQAKIGAAGMALLAERETARGLVIVLVAIPETLVILGFVVAVLIILSVGGI
jgi:V/A-type H+-transporting ATPase subunit K